MPNAYANLANARMRSRVRKCTKTVIVHECSLIRMLTILSFLNLNLARHAINIAYLSVKMENVNLRVYTYEPTRKYHYFNQDFCQPKINETKQLANIYARITRISFGTRGTITNRRVHVRCARRGRKLEMACSHHRAAYTLWRCACRSSPLYGSHRELRLTACQSITRANAKRLGYTLYMLFDLIAGPRGRAHNEPARILISASA